MNRLNLAAAAASLTLLAPSAAHAAPKRTPLYVTLQTPPTPVLGTDGRRHLVYELTLANASGGRAEVRALNVRAADGRRLLRLSGSQLAQTMANFAMQGGTTSLGPTEGGRLWLDVVLPRHARVPRTLVHRFRVLVVSADGGSRTFRFDAARTRVSRRAPLEVGPPLRGGLYMNFNGCCAVSAHRGAFTAMNGGTFVSERFAIDWIQVDANGAGGAGDLTKNQNFFTFGEPVLAVAAARVVSTVNDVPENVPFHEPFPESFSERNILGNHVILALGHGRFAAYAHLETGSVRVRVGQRVRRGQVLARVGNTGPSGGPHLHFQITDGRDPLASEGLPFVFPRLTLAGQVTNIDEVLTGAANADIRRVPRSGRRRDELPLQSSVVRFPG